MAQGKPYPFGRDQDGFATLSEDDLKRFKHKEYTPTWDPNKKFPPLKFFKHIDRATGADPEYKSLLRGDYKLANVTPKMGTEVHGIQLSQLDDKGKDELALLAAKRGLLIFRDQDFAEHGPEFVADYGRYYGPLHVHPTSGSPKTAPELHVVYKNNNIAHAGVDLTQNTTSVVWHSDVSYELQPTGLTFFTVLEGPDGGGDTIFVDTVEAYNRLSPEFKKRLEGLYVEHSAVEQAASSKKMGRDTKRAPVKNIHPLVRLHPVTGDKILYVNPGFSRRVVGLKRQESDALLQFLFKHIASGHDFQARANWKPGTVVVWDNRRLVHTAITDWDKSHDFVRLAVRISPQAERPIADLKDLNKEDENRLASQ